MKRAQYWGIAIAAALGLAVFGWWLETRPSPETTRAQFKAWLIEAKAADDSLFTVTDKAAIDLGMSIKIPSHRQSKTLSKSEYDAALARFERLIARSETLNPDHLQNCPRLKLYETANNLATRRRHMTAKPDRYREIEPDPDTPLPSRTDRIAAFEFDAATATGRVLRYDDILRISEDEFAKTWDEVDALEKTLSQDPNFTTLDDFAAASAKISTTEDQAVARISQRLKRVEAGFANRFHTRPKASNVTMSQRSAPRNAMASYGGVKRGMVLYWDGERFDHRYDMMLAVHEIMPGHHLQLTTKAEPICGTKRRRRGTGFLEGWATYAEYLAERDGFFDDPAQHLAWLDYRLIRNMRAIIDGPRKVDSLSKTDAQLIWTLRMPERLHSDFEREWERIAPSQHYLAYVFGRLAIEQARSELESKGDFDEPLFHRALLSLRPQNMDILAPRIAIAMDELSKADEKPQAEAITN